MTFKYKYAIFIFSPGTLSHNKEKSMTEQEKAHGRFLIIATLIVVIGTTFSGVIWQEINRPITPKVQCYTDFYCKVVLGSILQPVEYVYYEYFDGETFEHIYLENKHYIALDGSIRRETYLGLEPSEFPPDAYRWYITGQTALEEYRQKKIETPPSEVAF